MNKRAADVLETVLGKISLDLSNVLNNLGFVHILLLNLDVAYKYHKKALDIKK